MNYYNEIKNELINNEVYKRVKDYSKNKNDLTTYYNVGKLLSEAGKCYGEGIIKDYSERLSTDLNKKYDASSLNKMRKFYIMIGKVASVSPCLSYSHYVELLPYDDINKINYYIKITEQNNLSVRQLRNKIKNNEYERLDEETRIKLINKEDTNIKDLVKNPIIIKNSRNYIEISEKMLKQLILENIEDFMKELGNSFSFVGSEYRIKLGDTYNYIDLLLYNIEFNCYIVIELKVTELKKEHIGQIEIYMNYIDNNIKKVNHDKTIGIIICNKNNKYIIEYCSDKRIIAKEYELV